jgi:beta-aspartyl-peptidase (threonine type)
VKGDSLPSTKNENHFLFITILAALASALPAAERPFGLVIHGGAGVIPREQSSAEAEAEYRAKLQEALDAGYAVLASGGSALDAVVAAIKPLEDSPLFNAGKGAVLNADGICELDASIMDGRNLAAGAVAGARRIRNPIVLARAVMEKSPHVMFTGDGAERFAEQIGGIEFVPNEYFQTERRREELKRAQEKERKRRRAGRPRPQVRSPACLRSRT